MGAVSQDVDGLPGELLRGFDSRVSHRSEANGGSVGTASRVHTTPCIGGRPECHPAASRCLRSAARCAGATRHARTAIRRHSWRRDHSEVDGEERATSPSRGRAAHPSRENTLHPGIGRPADRSSPRGRQKSRPHAPGPPAYHSQCGHRVCASRGLPPAHGCGAPGDGSSHAHRVQKVSLHDGIHPDTFSRNHFAPARRHARFSGVAGEFAGHGCVSRAGGQTYSQKARRRFRSRAISALARAPARVAN